MSVQPHSQAQVRAWTGECKPTMGMSVRFTAGAMYLLRCHCGAVRIVDRATYDQAQMVGLTP